jgi:hypothetical protein
MRAWRTLRAICGCASDGKKLPGGFSQKILAWAAPGLIPMGAAGQNGLAPAVLEAVDRYTKSSSAELLELGFRPARAIGRGLHWLQQIVITIALPRVFGEWPCENAELGEVRRANFRRARF